MEWTNIAIVVGSIIASIFTLKKLFFAEIRCELKEVRCELKEIKKDIQILDILIHRIEDRLEYYNKYVQHEDIKKN